MSVITKQSKGVTDWELALFQPHSGTGAASCLCQNWLTTQAKSPSWTFSFSRFSPTFTTFNFCFLDAHRLGDLLLPHSSDGRLNIRFAQPSLFFSFSRQNRRHIWRGQTRGKSGCEKVPRIDCEAHRGWISRWEADSASTSGTSRLTLAREI